MWRRVAFLSSFLLLCFTDSLWCREQSEQPRVTIENGVILGKYQRSKNGQIFQSFQGIPYAKPPIDDRRFMEAEPLRGKWIGEWNATEVGSPCLQYDHFTRKRNENGDWTFSVIGDEDCLFLNVYTRGGSTRKHVIAVIHGGAFTFGEAGIYGPEYLLDLEDIVFVSMNYRLGPLGFLTTGDGVVPGNNGLKDQSLALEWIQRNIHNFGGDPNKVTLIGLSAGGASVHYHYFSDLSKGLFARGYSFSGSVLCPWALVTDGVEKTKQLARNLGCPTTDSRTMIKCLRRRPARKIVAQMEQFQHWIYNPYTVFGPVVEVDSHRAFLDDEPRNIMAQGRVQDLPWMTCFTTEDGLYPAGDFVEDERFLKQLNERWNELAPHLLFYEEGPERTDSKAGLVRKHYFGDEAISPKTTKQLIQVLSDRLFIAPAVEAAALQSQYNTEPVYLYSYGWEGSVSTSQFLSHTNNTHGASHGDDFTYVVMFGGRDTHINESDKEMGGLLLRIMERFVKKGSPPPNLDWSPVSMMEDGSINYLDIQSVSDVRMRNGHVGNVEFLRQILDGTLPVKDEL